MQAKCSCNGGIKDDDVCRCPCKDSKVINALHINIQARVLHFTDAFRDESAHWVEGKESMNQKVRTKIQVETGTAGVRYSIRGVTTLLFPRNEGLVPRAFVMHALLNSWLMCGSNLLHQVLCEGSSLTRLNSVANGAEISNASFGLLEVFKDGEWGTVCQSSLPPPTPPPTDMTL